MQMDDEESEIKIEYNETNENDPLADVFLSEEKQSFPVEDTYYEDTNVLYNEENEKLTSYDIYDIRQNDLKTQENYITWFQSKDTNGKLACKFCQLKYSTVQTLRHHVRTKHPGEATKLRTLIVNNKRNSKHICHICKKRFKSVYELKTHVSTNHCVESIKLSCITCNAMFNEYSELREHNYMKHQKATKIIYVCNVCGYRTPKKSHFNQHCNTHDENRPIFCQNCEYRTSYLPNLKIHERIHRNDKPYVCDFKDCDYRSSAKTALRSHQLKHFPKENMLYCEKCSYSTVYKQSLYKHLESHSRNLIRKN